MGFGSKKSGSGKGQSGKGGASPRKDDLPILKPARPPRRDQQSQGR